MEAPAWTKTSKPYRCKVNSGLKRLRAAADAAFGEQAVNRLGHTEEPGLGMGPGRAVEIADQLGFDRLVSNQPQYNMLWRVIETEVVPTCEELGLGQVVWSPIAQGVLTGKYKPGAEPPAGSRATDATGGAAMISRWISEASSASSFGCFSCVCSRCFSLLWRRGCLWRRPMVVSVG